MLGTTGVNGTCVGQAVCTVSGPLLNLIPPHGRFTSSVSHMGFWNVPRIAGACSCLRIFEVTVPWVTHYMTCHTFFGSLFKCLFLGTYIKSIPGHSPSSALALLSVIYHRFSIIILFVLSVSSLSVLLK